MKKRLFGTVVCLGALVGLAAGPAAAQMADATVRVNLPYAASVGNVTLPAGNYTIKDIRDQGGTAVLQITSPDGTSIEALANEVVTAHATPATSKVVLKQDELGYKLQSVWIQGQNIGLEFLSAE